jgi:hypothetical protein
MPDAAIVALAEARPEPTTRETLAQVQERLRALNETLALAGTAYRIWADEPAKLVPAPKNARFMRQEEFTRLVENVRHDGQLESLPFIWRELLGHVGLPGQEMRDEVRGLPHANEGYVDWIVSGHHRVQAAKTAGLPWVLYLFTDKPLSEGERIAKQLAHNAIAGEDNQAVLKELYDAIDSYEQKRYSGVDEVEVGHLTEAVVGSFQDAQLVFEEVSLLFLPHEHERFRQVIELLTARSDVPVYAVAMEAWAGFFAQILRYKENANVVNTTTAILHLTALAQRESDRLEREREEAEQATGV